MQTPELPPSPFSPEQQREQPKKPSKKVVLKAVCIIGKAMLRQRRMLPLDQQETIVAQLQVLGIPEDRIPPLKMLIKVSGKVFADREQGYRFDRYLGGGCGVFDLVLFQVLASATLTDVPLHVAWLALVCSLPCTVGFLVFCFLRPPAAVKNYGGIHISLSFVSVIGSFVAAVAFVWHLWVLAGVVFLAVGLIVGILSFGYAALLVWATYLIPELPVAFPAEPADQDYPDTLYG